MLKRINNMVKYESGFDIYINGSFYYENLSRRELVSYLKEFNLVEGDVITIMNSRNELNFEFNDNIISEINDTLKYYNVHTRKYKEDNDFDKLSWGYYG